MAEHVVLGISLLINVVFLLPACMFFYERRLFRDF